MSFTFRQLEVFVEAAQDENFRETADRLGLTQPAISKLVRELEARTGVVLFERNRGTRARLSGHGKAMLATAREMLARRRTFEGAPEAPATIVIRASAGNYLLDNILKPALPGLIFRFPHITLDLLTVNAQREIMEGLRTGGIDLALYSGAPPARPEHHVEILGRVPCSLYASADLAAAVGSDPAVISAAPFVLPTAGFGQPWILEALHKAGIQPTNVVAVTQFGDVMADIVRDGRGIGLLFDEHARARLSRQVRRLPVEIEPAWRIMIRARSALRLEVQPFMDALRRIAAPGNP